MLNLESMKLQMQAKSAADRGIYNLAASLTEQAAKMHDGKTQTDLLERAAFYREQDAKQMADGERVIAATS